MSAVLKLFLRLPEVLGVAGRGGSMQHVQGPAVMKVAEVAENPRATGGGSSVKYIIAFGKPLISLWFHCIYMYIIRGENASLKTLSLDEPPGLNFWTNALQRSHNTLV